MPFRKTTLVMVGFTLFCAFSPKSLAANTTCLLEADALYVQNNRSAAEARYRECKEPFPEETTATDTFFPTPLSDPTQLSPSAQTLWQNAQADTRAAVAPLQQLNQQHPEFTPAYINLAAALKDAGQTDQSLEVLEQAAIRFPSDADIARARVDNLRANGDRLDASIAARLFAIVNPDHPEAKQFVETADKQLGDFKGRIKAEYIGKSIGRAACGFFLRRLCGPQTISETVEMARMIVEGESGMGKRFANAIAEDNKQKGKLLEDPVITGYVTRIGKDVAALMGRDEFEYEFYVINEPSINAFALPGGKVFVHTGALLAADSEAEIAGLLAHEVAHAVLSHGYRSFANKQFLSSLSTSAPGGNLAQYAFGLTALKLSRDQERTADILAARALAGYGYAADGLYNFFLALDEQSANRQKPAEYLSTHPATDTRLEYLRAIIQQNGYNRYAYEGVKEHERIKQRVQKLLEQ